jgi:hypothetical protein
VNAGRGANPAVPTSTAAVGTADLAPLINRTIGAAFAHPTDFLALQRKSGIANPQDIYDGSPAAGQSNGVATRPVV